MDQIDLFAASDPPPLVKVALVKVLPAAPSPSPSPMAEDEPSDQLLATPASQVVLDNLPPAEIGEDQLQLFILADGSGPPTAIAGTMLAKWGAAKRLLGELWCRVPYRDRPPIFALRLPPIDRDRRRRIEALGRRWPTIA